MSLILIALGLSLLINILIFSAAFILKTNKLIDMSYGISFILLSLFVFVKQKYEPMKLLVFLLVIFWAVRLSSFLSFRITKIKKDKRFEEISNNFFRFLSFCVLQGISAWLILLSVLFFLSSNTVYTDLVLIGLIVWVLGFIIESLADYQKLRFMMDKNNKNEFIKTGLWRYSRHPNYFGEILIWIGIYLICFSSLSITYRIITLISPIYITSLLLFFTGIPKLENQADLKWGRRKEYWDYKKKTNMLVPFFPREKKFMKIINISKLLFSLIICLGAGFIGSLYTITGTGSWYEELKKPFFQPPNSWFGPVWTFLYVLMAMSFFLLWKRGFNKEKEKTALYYFIIQLILNSLWSIIFFGLKMPWLAFIEILILWFFIYLCIKQFYQISKWASWLLWPYITWVSFATILNLAIVILNI